ncbi:MAG: HAD hydrolase family protein, partial [Acidobacteriaceae bacterium]|nr:HAD hydrolase family protein [Acidobacteriaceae bacterium]
MQINSPLTEPELQRLAANIKILLMDVDGVLTDGRLYFLPGPDGKMVETKAFDSQDGIALRWLSWYDIKTGVISGRDSPATLERAQQVGMTWVFQGHIEKIPLFEKIMSEANVSSEQVAYVGDDLTDVVIMRRVGLSFATANARTEVK